MAANPSIQLGTDGNWAIKQDNLLAYKKDGTRFFNKEFDFTRGSLATFVDKDGLIKISGATDTELVTNGDFDTDSDWNKGTGWTISGGAGNASATFDNLGQTGYSFVINKTYKVTYEVKNYVNGNMRFQLTGGATLNGNTVNSNGIYTQYVKATANHVQIRFRGTNFTGSIDNVSVKEIQTDVPRIDFTDDATGHLLLEPQSTNLVTYSSDFSQWVWGGDSNANNTTRVDGQSSPDGKTNAALFTRNAGTSGWFGSTNLSVTLNQTYTYSLFVKKGTSSTIELNNVSNTPQSKVIYNIDTNTFTTENNATGSFVDYGNGWYRIAMTFEHLNTTSTSAQIRHILEDGESMYVFGSQFENQSLATSYIPTFGSIATRNAEVCNNSGSAQDFNDSEGVLYCEIAALADDETNRKIAIGSPTNRIIFGYRNGSNKVRVEVISSNSAVYDNTQTINNITTFNKFAVKYKQNDFSLWINSQKVSIDTSGNTPTGLNELAFDDGGANFFYGKTKNLKVFKRAMSDGELYLLTVTQYQSYQEMATALNYTS